MSRHVRVFVIALLFLTTAMSAQQVKRYRVTLNSDLASDPAVVAEQLARMCRGRIEPYAETGFNGFVLLASDATIPLLQSHPMVAAVAPLDSVVTSEAPRGQPPSPVVAPVASRHRNLQTDSVSEWSSGPYAYDGSGNITQIGTERFEYDAYGRLTSGTAGPGHTSSYTYDRFGNMLSMTLDGTTVRYGVARDTNQMSSPTDAAGDPAYYATYDPAGRVTQLADNSHFEYDSLGMITKSWGTVDGKTKIYIYTPSDERIGSMIVVNNSEASSEWTLRDASGKVLRRMDKTSDGASGWTWTWKQDYVYRETDLLASEIDAAPNTLHYFNDHLGSPRLVTSNGGMKIALHTYFPFGSEVAPVVSQGTGSYGDYDHLKFTGHERDTSMLDYMHARYYSAGLGRFLSVDPVLDVDHAIQKPQGWNRYSYVENDPVNHTDPNGRCSNVLTCAAWGLGSAGTAFGLGLRALGVAAVMYVDHHTRPAKPMAVPQALSEGVTWGPKIDKQLGKRGWNPVDVHDTVARPDRTYDTRDQRHLPGGVVTDDPATVYVNSDGSYVVVNDVTGDVVQVSDRNDPNWKNPWEKEQQEKDPEDPADEKPPKD